MNCYAEPFVNQARQFGSSNGRIFLTTLAYKGQDLLGELVRLLRAALVGNQAAEPVLLERHLRLIERGPRKAESRRRIGDRFAFGLHPAKHLVLDLDEVSGIEKAVLDKERVGDRAGSWIQTPLLP